MHGLLLLPRLLTPPRRRAWWLWLALLLPVAQAAAMCHAVSHQGQQAHARTADQRAPAAGHCELCVLAATVGGGALPSVGAAPPPITPTAAQAVTLADFAPMRRAFTARAHRSRAPPVSPR